MFFLVAMDIPYGSLGTGLQLVEVGYSFWGLDPTEHGFLLVLYPERIVAHQFLGFLGPKGEEPVPEAFQAGLDEIVELHATGVAVLSRGLFELLELIAKADCLSSDDYCGMCHVCPLF
jgi:hypothetical protein